MKKIIETERLILRPFTLDDIEATYQMNLNPEISRYTHDGGVKTREEIEHLIRTTTLKDYETHGFGRFAVDYKPEGRFIGFCGLKYLDDFKEVDIGYRFVQDLWGRGIATEAGKACMEFGFKDLKLDKIIGLVLPDNLGSVRVLQKLGLHFVKEDEDEGMVYHYYST